MEIRRVLVIGSGTMGGGIAAQAAGAGLRVDLLDVAPAELTDEERAAGLALSDRAVRDRLARASLERLKRSHPPALASPEAAALISPGNLEDDFGRAAEADWVVEAIVEEMAPKRELFARVERARKAGAVVTSNTSGLPIRSLAEGRSDDFRAHFLGTHFFNPPRYTKLLEVIPSAETDPTVTAFVVDFAERRLGKGVVVCKDTPNFIANRFGSVSAALALAYVLEHGYTVEEADAVLGPAVGRPKTALFRLQDLVGLDVAARVGQNLYELIPGDETREVLRDERVRRLREAQASRGRLGAKTGRGFYLRPPPGEAGDILTLDLETMEYRPRREPDIPSLAEALKIEPLAERLRFVLAREDRAGALARHVLYHSLAYAARRVPEIADRLPDFDRAVRWGYAHEAGPFEMWDMLGVSRTAREMESRGAAVAPWVREMLDAGHESFYLREGPRASYYDPARRAYVEAPAAV